MTTVDAAAGKGPTPAYYRLMCLEPRKFSSGKDKWSPLLAVLQLHPYRSLTRLVVAGIQEYHDELCSQQVFTSSLGPGISWKKIDGKGTVFGSERDPWVSLEAHWTE
eukprot:scaffold333_cov133-Cylindrotheca_fusiformis.AAC.46